LTAEFVAFVPSNLGNSVEVCYDVFVYSMLIQCLILQDFFSSHVSSMWHRLLLSSCSTSIMHML